MLSIRPGMFDGFVLSQGSALAFEDLVWKWKVAGGRWKVES